VIDPKTRRRGREAEGGGLLKRGLAQVLIPFNAQEAIPTNEAMLIAGVSERTCVSGACASFLAERLEGNGECRGWLWRCTSMVMPMPLRPISPATGLPRSELILSAAA
jgi:hypothetical protein